MLGPARSTGKSLAEQTERAIEIAAYGKKIIKLWKQEDTREWKEGSRTQSGVALLAFL